MGLGIQNTRSQWPIEPSNPNEKAKCVARGRWRPPRTRVGRSLTATNEIGYQSAPISRSGAAIGHRRVTPDKLWRATLKSFARS